MTLYHTVILYARILKCFLAIKSKKISKLIYLFFMATSCSDHDESKVLNFTREWAQTTYLPKWLVSLFCWHWTFTHWRHFYNGSLCQIEFVWLSGGLKRFDCPWHDLCTLYFLFNKLAKLIRCESYYLHKGLLKVFAKLWPRGGKAFTVRGGRQLVTVLVFKWSPSERQVDAKFSPIGQQAATHRYIDY